MMNCTALLQLSAPDFPYQQSFTKAAQTVPPKRHSREQLGRRTNHRLRAWLGDTESTHRLSFRKLETKLDDAHLKTSLEH